MAITSLRRQKTEEKRETEMGLTTEAVTVSRLRYGDNRFTRKKPIGFFRQFFHNLNDPIIRILIGALLLNLLFLFPNINWLESGGIALAVFIAAFVSTLSERGSNRAFASLYAQLEEHTYTVLRDGKNTTVPIGDIVTFDVVQLHPGEIVPADGILLAGEVSVDASALTGESRKVEKQAGFLPAGWSTAPASEEAFPPAEALPPVSPEDPTVLLRGSSVCSGNGTMLVLYTGDKTVYGAAASELQADEAPSPLKERLSHLAGIISKIGYASAAFVAIAHLLQAFYLSAGCNLSILWARLHDFPYVWSECINALTLAISIIVVAVPEGLPMMITVVLSSNMRKMMKNGVLVRRMVGIETAGSLSILFTDKTGTLTDGNLYVSTVLGSDFRASSFPALHKHSAVASAMVSFSQHYGVQGNQTDLAIGSFLQLPSAAGDAAHNDILPFDSTRKFCAVRVCGKHADIVYVRGAAEYLLPRCQTRLADDGEILPLRPAEIKQLREAMETAASQAGRVLLQVQCPGDLFPSLRRDGLQNAVFCFISMCILQDQIRPEVSEAVSSCKHAGVQVVMLTGDNPLTAGAIARQCGILQASAVPYKPGMTPHPTQKWILEGADLVNLSDDALAALLPSIGVISRVTPTDKSRLVRVARQMGHVVGMTGDGINDAPALRAADVGFAMGSGTDVAKEAGDIIITDDRFVSISKAILFGRTIFESIRKFIVFQLIMNLSAVGVSMLGPLVGMENPVTVIQMLWVNVIMDTLGSLAFAGEAPLESYMRRPPIRRNEPILTRAMVQRILLSAGYTILLCMAFLMSRTARHIFGGGDKVYFLTVFFALFIFCGINNAFTVRTDRIWLFANLSRNRSFLIIMPAVAIVQLIIVYFGGAVFRTVPIAPVEMALCALLALTVLPVDAVRKWFR